MSVDEKLFKAAFKLVKVLDKKAGEVLPEDIVGVVTLHSKMAVGSAFIPVSGLDIAASATSIWSMYFRINNKIGLSFSESVLKSVASGVATNLASSLAAFGVGSALKLIPGIGTIGGAAIMGTACYALTLTSGYVYLNALSLLLSKDKPLTDSNLEEEVDALLKDKEGLKLFMKQVKKK